MRSKSDSQKAIHDQFILEHHPWYSEFETKIVVFPKGEISQYEQILIDEVKG